VTSPQEARRELLLELTLPTKPEAVAVGRHALGAALTGIMDGDAHDVVMLLISELLTNAIVHGRPPISLSATRSAQTLRVEVRDGSESLPVERHPSEAPVGGWGLKLVSELASRWGADVTAGGKRVWFELERPAVGPIE